MNLALFTAFEGDVQMTFNVEVESEPKFLCSLEFVHDEERRIVRKWSGIYEKGQREDIKKGMVSVLNAIHQATNGIPQAMMEAGIPMSDNEESDALLSILFYKNPLNNQLSMELEGATLDQNVKQNVVLGIMEQILTIHNELMSDKKTKIIMQHNQKVEPIDYSVGA